MKKDYLSREEDIRFSKTVIDFNTLGEEADEKSRIEIRERTKLLIYIVSRDILHLSYDDASSVFLELEEELDKIIASYKVSNASDDLPDPESPVITINLSFGISISISFKLLALSNKSPAV